MKKINIFILKCQKIAKNAKLLPRFILLLLKTPWVSIFCLIFESGKNLPLIPPPPQKCNVGRPVKQLYKHCFGFALTVVVRQRRQVPYTRKEEYEIKRYTCIRRTVMKRKNISPQLRSKMKRIVIKKKEMQRR